MLPLQDGIDESFTCRSATTPPGLVETVSPGSRKTHLTHWNRLVERWPNRPITEPTVTELESLREWTKTNALQRSNGRGGVSAAENFVSAIRYLYRHAENDGHISAADNPARKVAKPARRPSGRSAIAHAKLAEINTVVSSSGDDPDLDSLLIRLHTETAARRGGALALRPIDLDVEQGVIKLREKGGTVRWQPVSRTLMTHLVRHSLERRAPGKEQLLRYRNGRPITYRRYDRLVGPGSWCAAVGRGASGQHALAAAYHADLGRAELR